MRATMRITWLLLSLSFLFHSICSEDVSKPDLVLNNTTSVMAGSNDTQPTTDSKPTSANTTGDDGKNSSTIQEPTTTKPIAAVTTAQIPVAAASKATDTPVTSQPQATTVKEKTATPGTNSSDTAPAEKNDSSPTTATPKQSITMTPAATSDSNGSSVVAAIPATVQTSGTSGSSNTSGTEAPAVSPGNTTNVETTKMPNAPTDALSLGKQSMAQTTTTSNTSQDSKGGIVGVIETVTSSKQNSSSPPDSAGNPGTTSRQPPTSNPTKDGPPVTNPLGPKAGITSVQTTSTSTSTPTPAKATTTPTAKATTTPTTTATTTHTTTTTTTATTAAQPKTFLYSLNKGHQNEEEKELVELCRRLMVNLKDGNCSLAWKHSNGTIKFDRVEINGMVKTDLASQYFEEITKVKKPTDNKTLIAILASCGALLIMIVILAVCASHHRKPYNENQQHLTEELHTVENGYHDNPTLEVMEVQPEMQEKKMVLNGEFNDSWIVPIDNLLKEDMPDEEDTHL